MYLKGIVIYRMASDEAKVGHEDRRLTNDTQVKFTIFTNIRALTRWKKKLYRSGRNREQVTFSSFNKKVFCILGM